MIENLVSYSIWRLSIICHLSDLHFTNLHIRHVVITECRN